MNNKGFTLIEFVACIAIIAIVFGIGFGVIRGTRSSTLTTMDKISEKSIINAAKIYILENNVSWNNDGDNIYACVKIDDMINNGYFKNDEFNDYNNHFVKVTKNNNTKVITDLIIVEECN